MSGVYQDIRYAVRWLMRSPGFALIAVLSLGLGVGVNAAMFTVVDALLLRPLPVSDPGSLVDVFTSGGDGDVHSTSSYPDYRSLVEQNTVFTDVIGYSPMFAAVSLGDRSRLALGQVVTSNHFQVLGVQPARGRLLVPSDDAPGAERVVVLSHRAWRRDFAAAADVVGRTLQVRGQSYTIVGVAPPAFTGVVPLLTPELWIPVAHIGEVEPAGIINAVPGPGSTPLDRRGYRWMFVKGRLRPGVTAAQARANVQVLGAQLVAAYPDTNKGRTMTAVPTSEVRMLVPEAGGPMAAGGAAVMAIVGLVLLIACANVAGLLLARASTRERELAVRAAIGASRRRLMQQLVVEGVVIGTAGVVVAAAVAWVVVRLLVSVEMPIRDLPLDLALDWRTLMFALALAMGSGVLASVSPAIKASSPSLIDTLRGPVASGRGTPRRFGLREKLVAGQMALTIVLLVVAGLLIRSLSASREAAVGFETKGLAVVAFDTDMVRYTPVRSRQFWTEVLARVRALPEVEHVALASPRVPFDLNFTTTDFRLDGRTYLPDQIGEILNHVAVTPDYFATLGVPVLRGRNFTDADREGTPLVAIVNEAMARRYWPDGSALGQVITAAASKRRYEIVGVVEDYRVRTVTEGPTPYVHFAADQRPATYNAVLVRTRGEAEAGLASVRRELLAMEPNLVFINHGTMDRIFAATLLPARVGSVLATAFGALGTLLAAIGLYGVIAFSVARRTREIGIRMALGADRRDVLRLIIRQGAVVVLTGALVGAALAALAASVLGGLLYGVGSADPIAWAGAAAVFLIAATLAHLLPARRAMRVDPAVTLRSE